MSSLTLYGSSVADATLTNACDMATSGVSAPTETSAVMTFSLTSNTYGEIYSQGGTTSGSASLPTPTGNGWVYQPGAVTIAAGNWSGTVTLVGNSGFSTSTLWLRFYKYSGGSYTSIGSISASASSNSRTTYSFAATAMSSVTFGSSDLLYTDLWEHDAGAITGDNPTVYESTSSSAGIVNDVVVTNPRLTLYGSSVADATITTANTMATIAEVGQLSTTTSASAYAEILSQGGTTSGFASLQTPTGKGWAYQPGAGTFATGNWSGSVTLVGNSSFSTSTLWLRFYKYSGGSYTSIGSISASASSNSRTTYSFAATSMSSVTFGSSDLLYTDLWWNDGAGVNTDDPTVYVSTSKTTGITSDMQVTTSSFSASGGGTHLRIMDGYGGVFS